LNRTIVHISEVDITEESGMGRISFQWKKEFQKKGYKFIHIGPTEVGKVRHPALFPFAAYKLFKKLGLNPSILIVHEPSSGIFVNDDIFTIVVSHGVERRLWNLALQRKHGDPKKISILTRILFPFWRLRQCDIGLTD